MCFRTGRKRKLDRQNWICRTSSHAGFYHLHRHSDARSGARIADVCVGRALRLYLDQAARVLRRAHQSCMLSAACMAFAAVALAASSSPAHAKVRLSGLTDVNFGTITNLNSDAIQAQSVCLFAQSNRYNIRADGSGSGGAFQIANGSNSIPYEVRWNSQGGQTNGTTLSPGGILSGLTTNAQNQNCASGPSSTASLILVLPASALSTATQGSYSGTLTLTVAEE